MKKAIIIEVYLHSFELGEVVTQVGRKDAQGHTPFRNEQGKVQYLDDTDFEYVTELSEEDDKL